MATRHTRRTLLVTFAALLAAIAATFSAPQLFNDGVAEAATGSVMPYAVEDFNYPGAAKIEQETGAVLKRGDGHMVMTTCDGAEDISIMSRAGQKDFCFNVTAKPAFLTLEIPQAYGIWTSDDPVKTTLRDGDGATTVINAPANDFTGYGESGQVDGAPTTLIELRVAG
ncbi:hypothetical protein FKN01_27665 [Streptomyces sp. 130]|uniref:hypothetical protein n=1 Tax=Streptomyces sp. 130 TaxID=2591006 RepID=UPI00117E0EA6|nr:hypothetical protein [Streptomyces sp. 130]TRV73341.1 hypothetical protein FKN01_27665 [Streptomyces sp. 130]